MPIYSDWTRTKILPMDLVSIVIAYPNIGGAGVHSATFQLYNPESDSTWSLTPITQPAPGGSQRLVAWRLSITAFYSYNDYETMQPFMSALALGDVTYVSLYLTALPSQSAGASMAVSPLTATGVHGNWGAVWSVESAEMRPRLKIELSAVLTRDVVALTGVDKLFAQVAGF